jgi:hypothetical protein
MPTPTEPVPPRHPSARTLLLVLAALFAVVGAWAQSPGGFFGPGELARPHAELSGLTSCTQCHDVGAGVSASKCMECHDSVREQVTQRRGFHADKGKACEDCHPDHRGAAFPLVRLEERSFDHRETGFALDGAHANTDCAECHTKPGVWTGLSSGCSDCHDEPHGAADGRPLLSDCERCHGTVNWDALPLPVVVFNHGDARQADYALHGRHLSVPCADCHEDWKFTPVAHEACAACHDNPHQSQFNPRPCDDCHTVDVKAFALRDFDHTATDWPLQGQHKRVACEACHQDGARARYVDLPHDRCETCHKDLHAAQFAPRACADCHTVDVRAFALRTFDHASTEWPLVGKHKTAACEACHQDGARARYVDLPHDRCETCHDDPHAGQFKPRDCDACHAATAPSFGSEGFDHDATSFPLRGAHTQATCESCHGAGPASTYAGLVATGCASCHEDSHAGRFAPATCESCHTDGAWEVASFDHAATGYALTGAHVELTCESCHGVGESRVACMPHAACSDCHTADSPHKGAAATSTCESCHRTEAWVSVAFDHATTGFAITGRHQALPCAECHTDPTFADASATCASCHETDRPPEHFDGACENCHAAAGWRPATLGGRDHSVTGFALTGVHTTLSCGACHTPGAATLGPFCQDCHGDEDPHRNLAGNTCESCHGTTDWSIVRFLHASTGWPLRGPHQLAACVDCHATGFIGTPTSCRRCHEADRPRDALHADPLTRECDTCHRPYSWEAASWPHGD